jgi:hypothetical protein
MPLSVNPNETFPYVLVTDREKPADERPEFFFRYLRASEADGVEKLFEASKAGETSEAVYGHAMAGILIALAGWRNVRYGNGKPLAFNHAEVGHALERADILELRDNLLYEMTLSRLDKKKSAFASQSIMAASAPATPAATA